MKSTVSQDLRKALALSSKGKIAEAENLYRDILKRFPNNRTALHALKASSEKNGTASYEQGVREILSLYAQGRLPEVVERIKLLVGLYPSQADLYNIAGAAHAGMEQWDQAIDAYDKAIEIRPDYAEVYSNRGVALRALKRLEDAVDSCDKAIALKPGHADAYSNRGIVLKELNRLDEAAESYERAIQLKPDYATAYYNRGNVLQALRRLDDAADSYDHAIRLKPDYVEAYSNRGNALQEMKRLDQAVASYDEAIRLNPDYAEAHANRANVLQELKRLDEAVASYQRAIRLNPGDAEAQSRMLLQQARMCQWGEAGHVGDAEVLGVATDAVSPFNLLAIDDSAERHLLRAQNWSRKHYCHAKPDFSPPGVRPDRLRIGYFSTDFYNHATMHLMGRLFEIHDKRKFEIHVFSYGPDADDVMRRRLIDAADRFHDVRDLSDKAVAVLARDQAIDIAVDLKGYTEGTRSGIFSYRAAPVQISYLGYPGSMGAEFIDYIVADAIVIPESHTEFYTEKVIRLPHAYQVNDNTRIISEKVFQREALGLPRERFVFCCFNNNYKISPVEFDLWMRLLAKVDGSILWLLKDNEWAEANLRHEAKSRGIDPNRLVFAERMALPEHLARHRCADLFLDTFNCNAHTTASDALWAGLPVITKLGDGFAARVAGSLLYAIGLPELVTETIDDYEQLALALATTPNRLAAVKCALAENRLTKPLFNTELYARHIEQAYQLAYDRYFSGLQPDHIEVSAIDDAGNRSPA